MISAVTRVPTWNGMSSSVGLPCPVIRAGGGQIWRCCSTAVSRPDWRTVSAVPAPPGPTRRDSLPLNGSAAGLVQALAGMALGALAGG